MGAIFGFIFGVMDVEDEVAYQIKLALLKEEHYCYPIGALLGALAGLGGPVVAEALEGLGGVKLWAGGFAENQPFVGEGGEREARAVAVDLLP